MNVVNLLEKLRAIDQPWSPRIVGELNGQHVKLAKLAGAFIWHHHEHEDELFLIVKGMLRMQVRDSARGGAVREIIAREGEFIIMPRGVEHRPIADEECHVLLFEPAGTLNTGNVRNERTVEAPERL